MIGPTAVPNCPNSLGIVLAPPVARPPSNATRSGNRATMAAMALAFRPCTLMRSPPATRTISIADAGAMSSRSAISATHQRRIAHCPDTERTVGIIFLHLGLEFDLGELVLVGDKAEIGGRDKRHGAG